MTLEDMFEEAIAKAASLDDMALVLQNLLSDGLDVWKDGRLMCIRVRVDTINGLRIEIRSREHAPPHFHVVGDGIDASFLISDGSLYQGTATPRCQRLVKWYYARSRDKLATFWNSARSTDCPVGPIEDG